jgi:poly-gamma-glutamate synthesis protein (capsule biosynthesis protein)
MDKPYTTYRSGTDEPVGSPESAVNGRPPTVTGGGGRGPRPPADGRPPRPRRRSHRGFYLTLALVAVLAAVAGIAVAGALPWIGGDEAEAVKKHNTKAERTAPPSPLPTPTPTPSPTATSVTIVAGGDVIGDRSIRTIISNQGGEAVFKGIAGILTKADLALVNLETPLTNGGDPQYWKDVVFKGDPRLAEAMADSGIDVVTMANNHAGDQGDSGLMDSIRHVRKAGIKVCGAGEDLAAARLPRFFTVDGVRVAFLGFTDVLPVGFPATSSSPGTSPGRSDVGAVKQAVRNAAKKADYVVVAWHWNYEFTTAPSSLEASEGRAMIDAGADLVIGHHPHVLQGVQAYHGGFIAWSTGNLVFDHQSGSCAQTMLVRAELSKKRIEVDLIPLTIAYDGRPKRTYGGASTILGRVKSYSANLGTKVTIDDGIGHVVVKR